MSKQIVYFGSVESVEMRPEYSLIGKLDDIISKLGLLDAVKDKRVVIKAHLGNKIGFTNIHPFVTGYIVCKIKAAGGDPFIIDIPENVQSAHLRGYTPEVIGCQIYPVAGVKDQYVVPKPVNYRGLKELLMGGFAKDGEILIDLSHVKGHNNAGFGGALKNLALGCFAQKTRYGKNSMHDTTQYPPYWDREKCHDAEKLVAACPYNLIKFEKDDLTIDFGFCNQCMRCVMADTDGCLKIDKENFTSFFEIMAMASKAVLEYYEPENRFFINFVINITTFCDCWGFTQGNILPDVGVLGSKDAVAIDKASLDLTRNLPLNKTNVPKNLEVNDDPELHPFARIHGPYKDPYLQIYYGAKYGLGTPDYELETVKADYSVRKFVGLPRFPKALKLF
ncbi:MAG: DUF362 domain-containing protein [Candidatus Bathyarchaeia archaeon]